MNKIPITIATISQYISPERIRLGIPLLNCPKESAPMTNKERVEKIEEKKVEKEKIEADSIDELIKAIKAKLYPDQYDKTEESDENTETETTM